MHNKPLLFALDVAQMLAVIGFAAATVMLVVGVWNVYTSRVGSQLTAEEERNRFLRSLRKLYLARVEPWNERRFNKKTLTDLEAKLIQAGNPGELKPAEFIGLQEGGLVLFATFGFFLAVSINLVWWMLPFFALLGWYYPHIWLRDQITKRHHAITRALPYNLDLLTLSVEAGLDFAQALGKVVEKGRQGPLVEEFRLVLRNLRLGKTREEGLRTMADRVQLPALTSFSSALIQADRMGTSLGKILRIQSTQLRIERTNRAEKLANEAPVKMLFPLITCIFPTVFMVLFGPIIFQAMFTQ
jgi:tight adherence protein C